MYTYRFPRPAVTVDVAIFMPDEGGFRVLLIKRGSAPYQGAYALPGGFVGQEESLEAAAQRELREETGLIVSDLVQVHTFSDPDRDPRGRVISTCFASLLSGHDQSAVKAGSDAAEADWFSLGKLPSLAFDHDLVIQTVVDKFLAYR